MEIDPQLTSSTTLEKEEEEEKRKEKKIYGLWFWKDSFVKIFPKRLTVIDNQ